jgi:hypothetical protein
MRCTNCGLPLSPTNTNLNCPRCHSSLVSEAKPVEVYPAQQYNNQAKGKSGELQGEIALQTQSQPPFSSSPAWNTTPQQNQPAFPPAAQTPFPQAGQMWQPDPTPPLLPVTYPDRVPQPMEAGVRLNSAHDMRGSRTAGMMYSKPIPAMRTSTHRRSNVGFILAGLCVITGGLILVFVYFMASGLPSTSTTGASRGIPTASSTILASPTTGIPSPTALPSPTMGAFPGQQYIDNPQMASMVNTNTAQPLQTTTTFKVNQRIYVTFNIHPNGKGGAVCLLWYLNRKIVTQFPFAVTASANAGYSYAIYGGAGGGYVEIYWASSTACSDKILAERVNFTVTS